MQDREGRRENMRTCSSQNVSVRLPLVPRQREQMWSPVDLIRQIFVVQHGTAYEHVTLSDVTILCVRVDRNFCNSGFLQT
jgi:hypothetical protein